MKNLALPSLGTAAAVVVLALATVPANAQATRTWVSGVGDDVNPCSRTAPCKTFAGAISKTATNGEINCLDPGGFGNLTITKSITIDCHEVFSSTLNAGVSGFTINYNSFQAGDVRRTVNIRNINFNGADTGTIGIRIIGDAQSANSAVAIEDCLINGNFAGNARGVSDERTNGGELTISNTTIRNVGATGISISPASGAVTIKATIDNVRVRNANFGLAAGNGTRIMITRSVFSGNTAAGVEADPGAEVNVNDSAIVNNGTGVQSAGGTIRLSNNDIAFNTIGVQGTVNSFTNNRFSSNGAGGTITAIGGPSNPTGQQ